MASLSCVSRRHASKLESSIKILKQLFWHKARCCMGYMISEMKPGVFDLAARSYISPFSKPCPEITYVTDLVPRVMASFRLVL
jgi:hypothetical protein